MDQAALPPTEDSPGKTSLEGTSRLFFLDHLRVFLVVLVVLHHVAVTYGSGARFYYVEPAFNDPLAFLSLLVFTLVNQSWFMGALFLISGYFTPGSFDRKGSGSFLKGRLTRLGIPLLAFFFIASLVAIVLFSGWSLYWGGFPEFSDVGLI